MPSLSTDIVGRVRRLPLKPSSKAALMPMFEAISNSLHAIDDRFPGRARENGRVDVEILREDPSKSGSRVTGFRVMDNGIGLNDENFESFLHPDSQHKAERGGKGVGRLDWLKVFKEIHVSSTYLDLRYPTPGLKARTFDFRLTNDEQVVMRDGDLFASGTGTRVTLKSFDSVYGSRCPADGDVIQQRIIGHFVQVLAADLAPAIVIDDCGSLIDLRAAFKSMIKDTSEENINIEVEAEEKTEICLTVRHIRADRAIRPDKNPKNYNWMFMSAHQRAVEDAAIDEAIGLKSLTDDEVYVGCVYGEYLDDHVNAERTAFTFDGDESRSIRRALINSIMRYLTAFVSSAKERKRKTALRVIEEYPQFLYLQGEMAEFIERLAPGATGKEQVFVEMCRDRFRKTSAARKTEATVKAAPALNEQVKEQMQRYQSFVEAQQQGVLAEYVLLRKSVIDILEKYVGFDESTEKPFLEEAVHKLIVPMRTDSSRVEIKDHQLWLLDDRLAFYSYFASDKQFKSYTSNPSLERPDIAFFYDTCFAWQEQDAGNTVVLVEFKRPDRDNYTDGDNPLRQVISYINKFRTSSSLTDARGRAFSPRLQKASFHCYIVADITDSLRDAFSGYPFHETPDGQGLVGYTRSPDAFVEVISYAKLLSDAKMRNAIFFQKLGLTDIDPSDAFASAPLSGEISDGMSANDLEVEQEAL